jgi:hypothetical protein
VFVQLAFPFLGNDTALYWASCQRQKGTETKEMEGSGKKINKEGKKRRQKEGKEDTGKEK